MNVWPREWWLLVTKVSIAIKGTPVWAVLRGRPLVRKRFLEGGAATEDRPYRTTEFSGTLHWCF